MTQIVAFLMGFSIYDIFMYFIFNGSLSGRTARGLWYGQDIVGMLSAAGHRMNFKRIEFGRQERGNSLSFGYFGAETAFDIA